uniref:Myosin motor domain-containing protein n=2 Tax=Anisakis simplex TaxID=6269 RepID=A0A0M3IZZ1_ANISI
LLIRRTFAYESSSLRGDSSDVFCGGSSSSAHSSTSSASSTLFAASSPSQATSNNNNDNSNAMSSTTQQNSVSSRRKQAKPQRLSTELDVNTQLANITAGTAPSSALANVEWGLKIEDISRNPLFRELGFHELFSNAMQ